MDAIAPETSLAPVAPPSMTEKVTMPAQPSSSPVAQVTLDYPERLTRIAQALPQAQSNPQARVQLADDIAAHDKDSQALGRNQKPQWGKVIANLLSRNYNEALKWYNGGGVVEEEARDLNNNQYFRQKNERGITGVVLDANGRQLSAKELDELNKRGGIFTSTDDKVLKTAPWVNGKYNAELANNGMTSQLQLATNDAYNAARIAGGANANIDEQLRLSGGLKNVLNHISGLPKDRREKIYGYVSRLNQLGGSAGKTTETGLSVQAGGQQGENRNVGLSAGGAGGGEGVPPTTGKIGGAIGASTSAGTQTGASGRSGATTSESSNRMMQEQQSLQTAIMQELQGVITSPAQFQDFMRLQSLNASNEAAYRNIPAHVKPPTWKDVSTTDPFAGGANSMIANNVDQQRNNALMAAWSRELYKSQREMAKTGKQIDIDKLAEDFSKSKVFEAINNTYKYKMMSNLEGRHIMPPKGSLMVNNRNEVGVSPGD